MFEEYEQNRSSLKPGKHQEWLKTDLSSLLDPEHSSTLYNTLTNDKEITRPSGPKGHKDKEEVTCAFPDFDAAVTLKGQGVERLHERLRLELKQSLQPLGHTPSAILFARQQAVWQRVVMATETYYSPAVLRKALSQMNQEIIASKEEGEGEEKSFTKKDEDNEIRKTPERILIEVGVKTTVSLVFSLLREAWSQSSWQRELHQALITSGKLGKCTMPTCGN